MNLLVDTNVLVHVSNPADPLHFRSLDAVDVAIHRGYRPCVVPQNFYEFWVVATRPLSANGLGLSVEDARSCLADLQQRFHLLRDERGIFDAWHRLVTIYNVSGKPAHDARLVAAMLRHGVTHLLTFNAPDFARFAEITALAPAAAAEFPAAAPPTD